MRTVSRFDLDAPGGPTKSGTARERGRVRGSLATLGATVLVCFAVVAQPPVAGASSPFSTPSPNVGIVPFSGDVYTVSSFGNLIAVDVRSTPSSAPLFNGAGDPLNLTWGEFSSATAKSYAWTVTRTSVTHTRFFIGMSGLVPNGVYSLFYRTFGPDSNNAVCPNVEPSVALTAAFPRLQKPDPDSFVASRFGRALFFASVAQDLLAAQQLQISVIYHFDGKTYGPVANFGEAHDDCRSTYGIDAMRQFLIIQK